MAQNAYLLSRCNKVGEKTVLSLKKRFFDAYYTTTKEEALEKAISLIPKTDIIAWGGSMSVIEIGLLDYILKNEYTVINRDSAINQKQRTELLRKSMFCDTYLMGVNSISEDGELVNIDCFGNRVAALMFGPKSVIVIASIKKVMPTIDDAIKRARTVAAPINMQRVAGSGQRQTPCFATGFCNDCTSKDSICSHIVVTRLCNPAKRIKVILTADDIGF